MTGHRILPVLLFAVSFTLPLCVAPAFGQPAPPPAAEPAQPVAENAVGEDMVDVSEMLNDDSFIYDPAGRRDPFESLLKLIKKPGADPALLPPIQKINLEKVKVSGIILDDAKGHRAMIKGDDGKTYVVKKGTIMGKNEGEVIEVSLDGIRVVEKFVDFMGRETLKEQFIKARPDKLNGK